MKVENILLEYKKKTITKIELENLTNLHSDECLYTFIKEAVDNCLLSPILSSKTNGNSRFPIYLKYRVFLPTNYDNDSLNQIKQLHPILQRGTYLQDKPEIFEKYKNNLLLINQYLFSAPDIKESVSRKERSFEIFEEEKVLDDRAFCALLEKFGLTSDILAFYDTPEFCFNDYIPTKKPYMTLLICENKDIWFNIRRMMFENHATEIFNIPIDGVIYGCGNRVCEKEYLTSYSRFFGASGIRYLYWGDIDREGFNIYLRLVENNISLNITLFVNGYQKMLELATGRRIPNSSDNRERIGNYEKIYNLFCKSDCLDIRAYIEQNKRLPQEIVSYAVLKENMGC